VADYCDIDRRTSRDVDENGIPDECEQDFDGDGILDGVDADIDQDGILNSPDMCDHTPRGLRIRADGRPFGDADQDCAVKLTDYRLFQACLKAGGPTVPASLRYCEDHFDWNGDDHIDLSDAAGLARNFDPRAE
jgi:hypothetical protein